MLCRCTSGLDIFFIFLSLFQLYSTKCSSMLTVGSLSTQLLQFSTNHFETLQLFTSWSGDVHLVNVYYFVYSFSLL